MLSVSISAQFDTFHLCCPAPGRSGIFNPKATMATCSNTSKSNGAVPTSTNQSGENSADGKCVSSNASSKRTRGRVGGDLNIDVLGLERGEKVAQGAEGVVYRGKFHGRACIMKVRFPKAYRHRELDRRLTGRRLSAEARTLLRLRKDGIRVPSVYYVNAERGIIVMQEISGRTLRECLDSEPTERGAALMSIAGAVVARMHRAGIVHGDLTTSNLLACSAGTANATANAGADVEGKEESDVVPIDFGLSSASSAEEDLAVDLYVLERAVLSTRPNEAEILNGAFFETYQSVLGRPGVIRRLKDVRARGRKRDMVG